MSNTYEVVCRKCKEAYWFGQGSGDKAYMYKPEKFMQWLVKHSVSCGEFAITNEYAENYPEWYYKEDIKTVSYEDMEDKVIE